MRKKLNRTNVIILMATTLTVAVLLVLAYSYYDRARTAEKLFAAINSNDTDKALSLLKSGADPNYVHTPFVGRFAAI
ncbi:MAG: hypothetical protein ABJA67_05085 [Chthonomonadales bacterium]